MKLYDYFRSSAAFRVRIALNLKGLDPVRKYIHLRDGEQCKSDYLEINPQGLVPTLIDENGVRHTQSLAIIEYLDEIHPGPPLLPGDPAGRSRVRSLALSIACDLHPLNNLRVLQRLESTVGLAKDRISADWYLHWVDIEFAALEIHLQEKYGTGRFCHGDTPGLADCCLVPQVFNANRFDADMSKYPSIQRIFDHCMDVPAFAAAHPAEQPDAE